MLPTLLRNRDLSHFFGNIEDVFFSNKLTNGTNVHFPRVDIHEDDDNYYRRC